MTTQPALSKHKKVGCSEMMISKLKKIKKHQVSLIETSELALLKCQNVCCSLLP